MELIEIVLFIGLQSAMQLVLVHHQIYSLMGVRMDGWMVERMNRWLLRIDGHISGCAEWHAISIPRFI